MLFTTCKGLHVQHDETLGLLRIKWVGGRNMQQLRPCLVQLLQSARQLQLPKVLFDMDTMAELSVFDQIWLATTWLPLVMQLPIKQVVVVMGTRRVYNQHAVEMLLEGFRLFMKFDLQFFTQPLPGMQWLLAGAPCPSALLAEWQDDLGGPAQPSQDITSAASQACLS